MSVRERPDSIAEHRAGSGARVALLLVAALAVGAVPAAADITLLETPDGLVKMTEEATVTWAESVYCNLRYGRVPGVHTDETTAEGWGSLAFTPASEGMSQGIYYCVVAEIGGSDTSDEFTLIVDSPVFPSPTAPANGSTVYETSATLQWDPVDGVPYYHVLVSDHDINVEEEDGNMVVTGANIIWQAITGATSIQYGSVDPSGFFNDSNGTSPPLMTEFDYHWLVFNNFGNNPLLTSTEGAGLSAFGVDVPVALDEPALVSPIDSLLVTDDYLTLTWAPVEGAVGYHVYIYESREWLEAEASFPVWDGATPTTSVEVHIGSFLVSGHYTWRVLALDSSGNGRSSETRSFEYATETGTARLRTKREDGSALPNVLVEIEYLSGGVNVLPTVTDAAGARSVELLPGEYEFHASKPDYVDTTATAVVPAGGNPYVILYLRRASARMRGVVEDAAGDPVFDADVVAVSGGEVLETKSDPAGNFALQAQAGLWSVHAEKPGYAPSEPVEIELHSDDYLELPGPLVLEGTPGTATGVVTNTAGGAVVGATVTAESSFGNASTNTNSSGHYALELAPGDWTLQAGKSGFLPSDTRTVAVTPGGNTAVEPPLVLTPAGSAVMGRVTDGTADCAGARVTAVPRTGGCVETTTNGYGEFLLMLPAGSYELVAECDGYAPSEPHQVTLDANRSYIGIELRVFPADVTVSGAVTDGVDPVAGAVVTDGSCTATTSEDGLFSLPVRPGLHELRASAEGFVGSEAVLVAAHPLQTPDGIELRISGGASCISGTVESDGEAVPRATVTASSGGEAVTARADDGGRYVLSVEAGEWTVTPAADGFVASSSQVVLVAAGQTASGVDLSLDDRSALVEGSVGDSRSAVAGALVLLFGDGAGRPSYRTSTDSDGTYAVRVAPGDGYRVVARAPGHGTSEDATGPLAESGSATVDLELPARTALLEGVVSGAWGPLSEADVLSDDGSAAVTDDSGRYALWVAPGLREITASCAGHEDAVLSDVAASDGQPTTVDFALSPVHATLAGSVTDSLTGEPVRGALVTAARGDGISAVTDSSGTYALPAVVPGDVALHVSKYGFEGRELELSLSEHEVAERSIALRRLTGTISGQVVESGGGAPLAGVAVRARLDGSQAAAAMTGADGRYVLSGLDPGSAYDVYASRAGYSPDSDNPLVDVEPGAGSADFVLRECVGVITGVVRDGGDGEPLAGASVTADNGLGHFGEAATNEDGTFTITGLADVGAYDVAASLYGYHSSVVNDVALDGPPVELVLPRNFARLTGTLTPQGAGADLAETQVVATNIAYAGYSRTAAADDLGTYELEELRPGSYVVSVSGGTHLCTPSQMSIQVGEGEHVSGVDFLIEKAVVERVEVAGPTDIEAGRSAVFSGSVFSQDGRLVNADLDWWVSPLCAGTAARSNGEVTVAEGYIGEMTVTAREAGSGAVGHVKAAVYVTVTPLEGAAAADSCGMSLVIGPGAVTEDKAVYLTHEELPDVMRYSEGHVVQPVSYCFKPCGMPFEDGHRPTLALPAGGGGELVTWVHDTLSWEPLESRLAGGSVEADIEQLGEFAVRAPTGPLGVSDVKAEPNPFAPSNGPTRISYELASNAARMPFVTVRIYNMASQLVRELVSNEPQGKGRQDVEWDGATDSGEAARNGRYVVEVTAEDPTGTERALGTVVLIK